MTMIVGYVSQDYAAIASDRTITLRRSGRPDVREDVENKAIVLNGQVLMGYTGSARLGGMATDKWVVDQLSSLDPAQYFSALTEGARGRCRGDGANPEQTRVTHSRRAAR